MITEKSVFKVVNCNSIRDNNSDNRNRRFVAMVVMKCGFKARLCSHIYYLITLTPHIADILHLTMNLDPKWNGNIRSKDN